MPEELSPLEEAAGADTACETEFDDWLEFFSGDSLLMLILEQCCAEGVMLAPDMRGTRLMSAPPDALAKLDLFLTSADPHVVAYIALFVFWVVRAERARRRGTPHWSPRSELRPELEEQAFFRPPLLRLRRYVRVADSTIPKKLDWD